LPTRSGKQNILEGSQASGTSKEGEIKLVNVARASLEEFPPEVVANILICLIHQTNYLLDQLLRQLEKAFVQEGGLRERMTRARLAERNRQNQRK
jgi:four helix bundle suffix protein